MATIEVFPCPSSRGVVYDDDYLRQKTGTGTYYQRKNPATGLPMHGGIDIPPSKRGLIGEPVLAVWSGRISRQSFGTAYGIQATVISNDGMGAFYAHLQAVLIPEGAYVLAGTKIAQLGNSGSQSTGAHLHFEKRKTWSNWLSVVNPYQELKAAEARLWPQPTSQSSEYKEEDVKTSFVTVGPLDAAGNGWKDWNPGLGRDPIIVGAVKQSPFPPSDGYWPEQAPADIAAQPRAGAVIVTVRGGKPGTSVGVFVSIA